LNGIFIILELYVDDMHVASKRMDEIDKLKAQMAWTFDMKGLRAPKQILAIEIHKDMKKGNLGFSQQMYAEKLLVNFGMNNVKPINLPLWLPVLSFLRVYFPLVRK